jgi:putative AdoMet-dependent methyltransferase
MRDFEKLFNEWAPVYDDTVYQNQGEYDEVFEGYDDILDEVVRHIPTEAKKVLEFGVGTGNLTQRLIQRGLDVIGVEPSEEMRKQVLKKGIPLDLRAGDFLNIPVQETVDAIVSTYAFHHLTFEEKRQALEQMSSLLASSGRIIFADTAYKDEQAKREILSRVREQNKRSLLEDLETEYYELLPDLEHAFEGAGFTVRFQQLNRFVWLMTARKMVSQAGKKLIFSTR